MVTNNNIIVTIFVTLEEEKMEEKEEFKDNLYFKIERGLLGWGATKKYPTILSLIIAIIVPVLGLFFVNNQVGLRKIEGKKPNHILVLAIIITTIWWGGLITALVIIF